MGVPMQTNHTFNQMPLFPGDYGWSRNRRTLWIPEYDDIVFWPERFDNQIDINTTIPDEICQWADDNGVLVASHQTTLLELKLDNVIVSDTEIQKILDELEAGDAENEDFEKRPVLTWVDYNRTPKVAILAYPN